MSFQIILPEYEMEYEFPIEEFTQYFPNSFITLLLQQGEHTIEILHPSVTLDVMEYIQRLLSGELPRPTPEMNEIFRQASNYLGIEPLDFITRDFFWSDDFLSQIDPNTPLSLSTFSYFNFFIRAMYYPPSEVKSFLEWWVTPGIGHLDESSLWNIIVGLVSRGHNLNLARRMLDQYSITLSYLAVAEGIAQIEQKYKNSDQPVSEQDRNGIRFLLGTLSPDQQRETLGLLERAFFTHDEQPNFWAVIDQIMGITPPPQPSSCIIC